VRDEVQQVHFLLLEQALLQVEKLSVNNLFHRATLLFEEDRTFGVDQSAQGECNQLLELAVDSSQGD